ncbi:MAG: pyruvate dehydrogenase complex dihydrolipoamide acetyltransferase [Alphaproteobacteria bacterium]
MAQPILMPALSPTMEEGTLARWLVKEGDTVNSGDIIAEIETDKATMEVEAVDEGIVAKIIIAEGSQGVKVNSVIAVLAEDGDSDADITALTNSASVTSAAPAAPTAAAAPVASAPKVEAALSSSLTNSSSRRLFVSPLAKRIAANAGLDLTNVQGTGPKGRIIKHDVEAALNSGTATHLTKEQAPQIKAEATKTQTVLGLPEDLAYEDIPNNGMRKTIAARLTESKNEVPHYYVSIDCELDALLNLRKTLNAQSPEGKGAFKISVNDMIIKAAALALKEVPAMNVAWGGDFIRRFEQADIAVAVATEGGLITPIVKNAGGKGLSSISNEMKDLAGRAKEGKLAPSEYQGATFTISNLGMFGVKDFTAIVNPPAAGILAIGAGEQRPIVKDGAIAIANVMTVTLSADHRSTDGAVGALFVKAFKKYIENPLSMML